MVSKAHLGGLRLSQVLLGSRSDCLTVLRDLVLKEPLFGQFWDGVLFHGDWVQLSPLSKVMERSGQLGLALEAGEQGHTFAESPRHRVFSLLATVSNSYCISKKAACI